MPIYDLTHTLYSGMPVFPGDPEVRLAPAAKLDLDGYAVTALSLGSHAGTHMDAPAHMLAGASTLDALPVERFMGSAMVIDCAGAGPVIAPDCLPDCLPAADFLLFSTGWAHRWGSAGYFQDYPVLAPETARALADRCCKGIGIDTPSVDLGDKTPIHHTLFTKGLVIVENLTGLEPLIGRRFQFCAFPLHYKNADGAPVRAIAVCPEEDFLPCGKK